MENLTLNELTKRKLEDTYVVVYAIKNEVNIKKADIIDKIRQNLSDMERNKIFWK